MPGTAGRSGGSSSSHDQTARQRQAPCPSNAVPACRRSRRSAAARGSRAGRCRTRQQPDQATGSGLARASSGRPASPVVVSTPEPPASPVHPGPAWLRLSAPRGCSGPVPGWTARSPGPISTASPGRRSPVAVPWRHPAFGQTPATWGQTPGGTAANPPDASGPVRTRNPSQCRVGGGALDCSRAGLRPPLKLDVRFSRIQLSRRRFPLSSDGRNHRNQVHEPILAVELVVRQSSPTTTAPTLVPVRPDPAHQPLIEPVKEPSDVGPLVVVTPPPHDGIELLDQLRGIYRSFAPR